MSREEDTDQNDAPADAGAHIRQVRLGHGANCSSIGSVVDTLFATATVGAAVFAAVVAALAREPITLARRPSPPPERPSRDVRPPGSTAGEGGAP
jgi:hypothetical protein